MRILIAEDDPISREALKANLEIWGHEVVVCEDGIEAREVLRRPDPPPLAILDWMMPGMDGIDVCKYVREHEEIRQIYIMILTARGRREDLIEGLQVGADDYIVKPFDRQELKARIQVGIRVIGLQKQLLEAEQDRVLAETAGAAAHEINQPLTVIIGKLELLLDRLPPEDPLCKDIKDLQFAGQRIHSIVRKMLDTRKYVTKPYVRGAKIVDFEAASQHREQT